MKNVMIFLWGMLIASGWWGIGLMSYNGMEKSEGFAPLTGFTIVFSVVTTMYIIFKVVSCVVRCWND